MDNQKTQLRTFICVDYPGLVKNEKEAIRTLGGMDRISQAFSRRNSKLLLNFTPDNIFSKTLCSNQITDTSISQDLNDTIQTNGQDLNETKTGDDKNENTIITTSSTSKQNDLISIPCLLMSVKKSKEKNFKIEIIGKIKKNYTFQKMADFQYLPMSSTSAKMNPNQTDLASNNSKNSNQFSYTAFYENFLFNNIQNYDYELRKNILPQLFILPPFFSRFDDPVNYSYRSEPTKKQITDSKPANNNTNKSLTNKSDDNLNKSKDKSNIENDIDVQNDGLSTENQDVETPQKSQNDKASKDNKEEFSSELIRSMRQERSSQALLVAFNEKIPLEPSEKLKPPRTEAIRECINKLTELFKQRPCYLKSVLLCITNFSPSILKESLPYVAYYFTTGPWRSCWVRYGYDPRLNQEAKIYQMIDYRLRNTAEPEHIVKSKPRSSYHKRKFRSDLNENEFDDYKNFKLEEEMYKFKPDKLPGSRNVFYQICDIEDIDVQNLIQSEENKSTKCNEKDGWCMTNIQDKCRNIMSLKHEKLSKILANESKEGKKIKIKNKTVFLFHNNIIKCKK